MILTTTIMRFLFLVSLLFWQGGFMFYGGVVVPVGGSVLGSDTDQGFITQSVTNYLNMAGVACLLLWLVELSLSRKTRLLTIERSMWGLNSLALSVLVLTHQMINKTLNREGFSINNPSEFDSLHKIYIGTSSVQWALSLVMLFLMLLRWNQQDSLAEACRSEPKTLMTPQAG